MFNYLLVSKAEPTDNCVTSTEDYSFEFIESLLPSFCLLKFYSLWSL